MEGELFSRIYLIHATLFCLLCVSGPLVLPALVLFSSLLFCLPDASFKAFVLVQLGLRLGCAGAGADETGSQSEGGVEVGGAGEGAVMRGDVCIVVSLVVDMGFFYLCFLLLPVIFLSIQQP